jgi:hypothetical protein
MPVIVRQGNSSESTRMRFFISTPNQTLFSTLFACNCIAAKIVHEEHQSLVTHVAESSIMQMIYARRSPSGDGNISKYRKISLLLGETNVRCHGNRLTVLQNESRNY